MILRENCDGDNSDGDSSDGDSSDGDNSDGDNSDGDNSDGDNSDGDNSDGVIVVNGDSSDSAYKFFDKFSFRRVDSSDGIVHQ